MGYGGWLLLLVASGVVAPGSDQRSPKWDAAVRGTEQASPKWDAAARTAAASLAAETLNSLVSENKVVIFSRGRSSASARVKSYFEDLGIPYYELALDQREDGPALQNVLASRTGSGFGGKNDYPVIFISGQHVGNSYKIGQAFKSGELEHWVSSEGGTSTRVAGAVM